MMTVAEILDTLEYFSSDFPRQALEDARAQKTELVPALIAKLETLKGNFCAIDSEYFLHIYAFFLLAEFRATHAFPLIVDLLMEAGDKAYDLFDDFLTEELPSVMASLCGGELGLLFELMKNSSEETVRGGAIETLVVLYVNDQLTRAELLGHLETIGRELLEKKDAKDELVVYTASYLVAQIMDIYGIELKELIDELFAADLIDEMFVSRDDVEKAFPQGSPEKSLSDLRKNGRYQLINNTIEEMEWWHCFESESKKSPSKYESKQPVSGFGNASTSSMKISPQKKTKQKQQKQSRKKNRQKKKR